MVTISLRLDYVKAGAVDSEEIGQISSINEEKFNDIIPVCRGNLFLIF
jgi:hypothetical protein